LIDKNTSLSFGGLAKRLERECVGRRQPESSVLRRRVHHYLSAIGRKYFRRLWSSPFLSIDAFAALG